MYTLAGINYKTKVSVEQKAKDILAASQVGKPILGADFEFIKDLIAFHPEASIKTGSGIKAIVTRKNPPYYTKGFFIIRTDGTAQEFSYKKCLNGEYSTQQQFNKAARSAIAPFIQNYKRTIFSAHAVCPMTGKLLSVDNCHIDHAPPYTFSKIISDFIDQHRIDISNIKYLDDPITYHFADKRLESNFIQFHNERAVLRAVDSDWNTRAGNRSKI